MTEPGAEVWLAETVLENLAGLGLIERRAGEIIPRPALGRFALRPTADLAETEEPADLFGASDRDGDTRGNRALSP